MSLAYLLTNTIWTCLFAAFINSLIHFNHNFIYSTGINGDYHHITTWPLTDISGYYVIGFITSNIAKICKYTNKIVDRYLSSFVKLL